MRWIDEIDSDNVRKIPVNYYVRDGEEVEPPTGRPEPEESESQGIIYNNEETQELQRDLVKERESNLRLRAEIDNIRKRAVINTERDVVREKRALLLDLLSQVDDFERAIEQEPSETLGVLYAGLAAFLEKNGVKKMKVRGKRFDPEYHEAIMMEDAPGVKSGVVTRELLPGYIHEDELLRPARVAVAK